MNKLERVLATINHEEPDVIPNQEEFFDITSQKKFAPEFDFRSDLGIVNESLQKQVEYAEFMDIYIINVGYGGLRSKVVQKGKNEHTLELENGAKWRIIEHPYYRQYIDLPIKKEEDIDKIPMPDPRDPRRYEGVKERVKFFTEKGYFTTGVINGFFSGVWYRFRKLEDFLMDIMLYKDFAKRLIKKVAEYNLASAEELLKRGVHSISFPDDMGTSVGMFFSPECYKEYFYEWHKKLCALCHKYGAYVNMHSHGNINAILPLLVDAGIDILNPIGPTDKMNLKEIKEKYGSKITLLGGISKFIGEMSKEELESHVEEIVRIGSKGGGYMTKSEGGIPYTMTHENFRFYLHVLQKYREKYGAKNRTR